MNRNQNSHFAKNPTINIHRSRFDRSHSVKLSFDAGLLIPFYCDEILPGDTFQIDTSKLIRMQTLAAPIMDNLYLDTYYFFVPNRLVWDDFQRFMGENEDTYWTNEYVVNVPNVNAPSGGWNIGTIADYFGIPTGKTGFGVNALPFRGYALIWNEWFRDENLQVPQVNKKSTGFATGANLANTDPDCAWKGGYPLPVSKFKDYFTSCLPSPQKGPDVLVPLGDYAPVITGDTDWTPSNMTASGVKTPEPLHFRVAGSNINNSGAVASGNIISSNGDSGYVSGSNSATGSVYVSNLLANLKDATAASINQLRLAFQIQKIYEKDARSGTRYIEILHGHFSVTSPDARLQRPEYLGGNRMLINVNQVIQQSESGTTPQGTTTAYSLTVDNHSDFTHSFVEHGFVIGVMCARYDHTYQQGLEKFWTRRNRFDYYFPSLANIGEQPVLNKEIFLSGDASYDNDVFGYQEAWADYRYKPNRVCGEMRSSATNSLDVWHLADDYADKVYLSDSWIREDKTNLDRALAVSSETSNQLFGDIYIKNYATRPMPLFSIPGLIDHY